eukprot:s32_g27.t1
MILTYFGPPFHCTILALEQHLLIKMPVSQCLIAFADPPAIQQPRQAFQRPTRIATPVRWKGHTAQWLVEALSEGQRLKTSRENNVSQPRVSVASQLLVEVVT